MSNKKTYIVLITIIFVFFIIMFALFGVDNLRRERYKTTLIVGDNTVWAYQKKSWLNLTNSTLIQDLYWDKYKVYVDNEEYGDYLVYGVSSKTIKHGFVRAFPTANEAEHFINFNFDNDD